MDGMSFASLAQIKILLLPVGRISQQSFEQWANLIRSFDHIRLDEIPPDTREGQSRFMPAPMSNGYLHLSYPSHPPPPWHTSLSLFRISHFPLGVIGIADCSNPDTPLTSVLAEFHATLEQYFPVESAFPLASRCYAFEEGDENPQMNMVSSDPRLVVIPSVMGNKQVYVGTLISELCTEILSSFANLAKALESASGITALNGQQLPVISRSDDLGGHFMQYTFGLPKKSRPSTFSHSSSFNSVSSMRDSMETPSNGIRPHPHRATTGMPASPSGSMLTSPASKKRTTTYMSATSNGRLGKLVADLYLLSGRTSDAVQWYVESLAQIRGPQDMIWQASALEGMCLAEVLDLWSATDAPLPPVPGSKPPWSDISARLEQAVSLYSRASPAMSSPTPSGQPLDTESPTLSLLLCQAALRHAHFLLSVWSNKGMGRSAFDTMLGQTPFQSLSLTSPSEGLFQRMSVITSIPRSLIAEAINSAHGPHIMNLLQRDQLQVLSLMAAMFSCLGFRRKEVYILREVLAVIMDMIVASREEATAKAAKAIMSGEASEGKSPAPQNPGLGIAGAGFEDSSSIPNSAASLGAGTVGVRANVSNDGNESILRVVKYVCDIYGVDLSKIGITRPESDPPEDESKGDNSTIAASEEDEGTTEAFGWPELQLGVVREAVAIAEALPDYPALAQFSLSTLRVMNPHLTHSEQLHLYTTSGRALATARRRGDHVVVAYWASKPVLSLEITPLPFSRTPVQHPISDLEPRLSGQAASILGGRRDPFIYNPRLKSASASEVVTVQNEPMEFVITLYNRFCFDLEVQSVRLSTSGVALRAMPVSTLIPAESYRVLRINATATEPGVLTVRGIWAQLPGGAAQEFLLPLATDEEERRTDRRRSILDAESLRTKSSGLAARPEERSKRRQSLVEAAKAAPPASQTFLTCKVVEEQPLLRIRRTTLSHGAVMLYNGETSTFRLTVENISSIPVDFVKLAFDDTSISIAQQALADGELSVAEAYETEYDLVNRPVFSYQGISNQSIGPEKKATIAVTCFGKLDCSHGSIQISYSFAHRPRESPTDVFHTRQIIHPVEISVFETLRCETMDVTPFWHTNVSGSEDPILGNLFQINNPDQWCLFSVEVSNKYDAPFEVTFDRVQDESKDSTTRLVSPGATVRVILPLKRLSLPGAVTQQPIPTLSNRQFVVSKEKLSVTEEQIQRELFWYREHLFKSLRAHWREPSSGRQGEVYFRSLRLTMPMLRALQTSPCKLQITLIRQEDDNEAVRRGPKYIATPCEFYFIRARVTNYSTSPLSFSLSYVPAYFGLMDSALFDSSLSQIPVGLLAGGDSVEVDTGVCFVDSGVFEFKAILQGSARNPTGSIDTAFSILVE
ncbi:hypothetical protein M407DRAFT_72139 [Tulasnella calospora MUT 4182]|uniref:Uncharacterized protein n=1 Tax=Tulasnella calospora MUT 4182 TaxID=1051891 RepID=A0A0C3QMP5_9AGAM|nr:hypothetical protein M407DRAFT_72139 [Tulasnella calospora MUT 4182]